MANINLIDALKELTSEKNIPMDVLIKAIKEALVVAYRKMSDADENIEVRLDEATGEFRVISLSIDGALRMLNLAALFSDKF